MESHSQDWLRSSVPFLSSTLSPVPLFPMGQSAEAGMCLGFQVKHTAQVHRRLLLSLTGSETWCLQDKERQVELLEEPDWSQIAWKHTISILSPQTELATAVKAYVRGWNLRLHFSHDWAVQAPVDDPRLTETLVYIQSSFFPFSYTVKKLLMTGKESQETKFVEIRHPAASWQGLPAEGGNQACLLFMECSRV